jgi:LysM repeat protein
MAAKKSSSKKFKQARKAAVADAKGAFTSGKTKAVRRDPMAKVSAEDKAVLSEVKKEAKAGYITDDKGNKVFSKPTETAQERFARDRREAKAAVDRKYATEDAKMTKAAPAKPAATAASKPATKKPSVTKAEKAKPTVAKPTVTKSMTRAEKSAANKAAWAKMSPAERKNWKSGGTNMPFKPGTTPKPKNMPYKTGSGIGKQTPMSAKGSGVAAKGELTTAAEVNRYKAAVAAGKSKGEAVRIAKGGTANLPAVVAKKGAGTVATTGAKSAAKKLTVGGVARAVGKGAYKAVGGRVGLAITAASLAAGPLHKALSKDTKGRTSWDNMKAREKAVAEGRAGTAEKMTNASYGRAVPGAASAAATKPAAAASRQTGSSRPIGENPRTPGKPNVGAGGTTTTYRVETGDTLSGIAKKAGVTLSELMAENKKIKDPRKIYRNTTVKIPAKGKMPTPMYTGPVPYVPGSKAAKAYEASRKK